MNLSQIILGPVVTEKSMHLLENSQTVIMVHADASKEAIKQAIEKFYGVKPKSINIVKLPEKFRVRGRYGPQRKRKPRKKAIVTLPAGKSLDLLKLSSPPKAAKAAAKKNEESANTSVES